MAINSTIPVLTSYLEQEGRLAKPPFPTVSLNPFNFDVYELNFNYLELKKKNLIESRHLIEKKIILFILLISLCIYYLISSWFKVLNKWAKTSNCIEIDKKYSYISYASVIYQYYSKW